MPRRTTTLGTPAAPSWSAEWLVRVESEEKTLRRRICGAMTQAATPCTLGANHPSGRCRYHGGVIAVGPPSDNQNARIHGLYARRLQRCGPHCPLWKSCAFSGDDVMNLPEKQRPICAYERDEYAALMRFYFKAEEIEDQDLTTESTESTERGTPVDPTDPTDPAAPIDPVPRREIASRWDEDEDEEESGEYVDPALELRFPGEGEECPEPFLLHQLVLLTVMQTRAAAVLSAGTLTDAVEVDSPGYKMKTAKPGAALEAFIRIAREWRALRGMIDTKKLVPKPRQLGLASQMAPLIRQAQGCLEEALVDVPSQDISKYIPAWAKEDDGAAGEASSEAVNSEVASGEVKNNEIDAGSGGAADSDGETVNGEPDASSSDVAAPVAESEPLSREELARQRAALRPPPVLGRDRRSRSFRSPIDGYLFGDRGG